MNVELGVIATVASIVFAYLGYRKGVKDECRKEGVDSGSLRTDLKYIRERTDDVYLEQKDIKRSFTDFSERLVRVEESSKQAHKRLDSMEK